MLGVFTTITTACESPYSAFRNKKNRINWVSLLNNVAVLFVELWFERVADLKQQFMLSRQPIVFYEFQLIKKNKYK